MSDQEPRAHTWVGRSVRRRENARLLRGRTLYVDDVRADGMLELALVTSPFAHARIAAIDLEACRRDPRAFAVLSGADVAEVPAMPCFDFVDPSKPQDYPVLAQDVVRYVGDPVVAVLAADRYAAEDIAALVHVEYEPMTAVVDPELAILGDTVLHSSWGSNVFRTEELTQGDAAGALAASPRRMSKRFRIGRMSAAPLETRQVLAQWDEQRELLTVHSSTQVPHTVRTVISGMLGLAPSAVRVISPDVGGGFGQKCVPYREEVLVALLAMQTGRPVKWVEDRTENLIGAAHAREQIHNVDVGYGDDGVINALIHQSVTDNGAYLMALAASDAYLASASLRGPYRIPNFQATALSVVTNKAPTCPYRGVGMAQGALVMERVVDMVAAELGVDPAEIRRRNVLGSDELPLDRGSTHFPDGDVILDTGDYGACLDKALELVGYDDLRREQSEQKPGAPRIGIGIGLYVEETGMPTFESATVRVDASGMVTVLSGSHSHGQGHETTFAQLCAERLGVQLESIRLVQGDTDLVEFGMGTYGSRSAVVGGTAVVRAADAVRAKAAVVAGGMLGVDIEELDFAEGRITVRSRPDRSVSLAEVAQALLPGQPLPDGVSEAGLAATDFFHPVNSTYGSGAHVSVVEVDLETFVVRPRCHAVVSDAGVLINPMVVDGQIKGGVAQGIGEALLEELVYNSDGQLLNASLMDYLLPTADFVPPIKVAHLCTPSKHNPLGMKGIGEGPVIGSFAAVANAVADAVRELDIEVTYLPVTPSRLHELWMSQPQVPV